MSFGFGFALPAYPLRGGGGNNPFNQLGPTLDLSFVGTAGDLSGADTYTLNTDFITPEYQVAAQYAVWENGVGLAQKTFSQIVTFSRTSGATWFNSAGVNVGIDFSTSSVTIGTGSKTFTLTATAGIDRSWAAGDIVRISEQATPANFMDGAVTSYTASTQTLVVNVTATGGSGTIASWRVSNWMPRFDYDPATLLARGLLIEEARTNLSTNSVLASAWGAASNASYANTQALAPDGTNTAWKLTEDLANSSHYGSMVNISTTYTSGTTYTVSRFLKASGRNVVTVYLPATNFATPGRVATFNLTTGVVVSTDAGVTATIQNVGNGWYRCSTSAVANATGSGHVGGSALTDNGVDTYQGDGTSGAFVWGHQVEVGAFPTSYIPTTVASATRNADVASVNTLSPWYNATEGTLFAEWNSFLPNGSQLAYVTDFTDNPTLSTAVQLSIQSRALNNQIRVWQSTTGGGFDDFITLSVVTFQGKTAVAYGGGSNVSASANGGAVSTMVNPLQSSVFTNLLLGYAAGTTGQLDGWLRRITYYPRRLSNAELQTITT